MSLLPDAATLASFLGAGVLLNLTPGADVMFATASGIAGGPRAGIAAAFGVGLGALLHTALAAFGLAALLAASPAAYDALRYVGAAYLVFLAVKAWRSGPEVGAAGQTGLAGAVRRGFVVNALNPKVALFVLAFLPQFADPTAGPLWAQILALGALFSATGVVITASYGVAAGLMGRALTGARGWLGKLAAVVYGGLALRVLFD